MRVCRISRLHQRAENMKTRLHFWMNLLIILALLTFALLGQWDWVLAGAIGLIVGNGLTWWRDGP